METAIVPEHVLRPVEDASMKGGLVGDRDRIYLRIVRTLHYESLDEGRSRWRPRFGVYAVSRVMRASAASMKGGLGARLTSLRRDEERSFTVARFARPYYICSALTADLLAAARGLLAVSTWPMDRRIVGPLSPRVDFLTAASAVAEHVGRLSEPGPAAARLLWRFAANIPGAAEGFDAMKPAAVARAAQAELAVHQDADRSHREAAGHRARRQLSDVEQLFGSRLRAVREPAAETDR